MRTTLVLGVALAVALVAVAPVAAADACCRDPPLKRVPNVCVDGTEIQVPCEDNWLQSASHWPVG